MPAKKLENILIEMDSIHRVFVSLFLDKTNSFVTFVSNIKNELSKMKVIKKSLCLFSLTT